MSIKSQGNRQIMQQFQYIKLAKKLSKKIENGELAPGTRLPTHRSFAEKHNIALATATRVRTH